MMWGYGFNGPNMTFMLIGMTLCLIFLVILVWVVIRWLSNRATRNTQQTNTPPGNGPTAKEILRQRYANGEIDATTFAQMQERLDASDNEYQGNQTLTGMR